jgi:hypothetical protein
MKKHGGHLLRLDAASPLNHPPRSPEQRHLRCRHPILRLTHRPLQHMMLVPFQENMSHILVQATVLPLFSQMLLQLPHHRLWKVSASLHRRLLFNH